MKRLLLKLLLKYLSPLKDLSGNVIKEKIITEWLAIQFPTQGFKDYVYSRSTRILQEMGEGVNEKDYQKLLGRREELAELLTMARVSFEKVKEPRPKEDKEE